MMKDDKFESALSRAVEEKRPRCPDFAQALKDTTPDESLVAQVVECFSKSLSAFAGYYCRDESLGKDAFQEAMLTTITKLDTYRGESPIEPWLRRIVVSSCSRLRRGLKNDPSVNLNMDGKEGSAAFADSSPNQEIQLMMAQGLTELSNEIDDLPEPDRTLILSHDVEEVPIKVLSERHGLTVDAVKSRLKRARAAVRERVLTRNS